MLTVFFQNRRGWNRNRVQHEEQQMISVRNFCSTVIRETEPHPVGF